VAVGTLDMALWDAAAKIAELPLNRFLADHLGRHPHPTVRVYAGGGYYYPRDDARRLTDELQRMMGRGYTHAKIKIGSAALKDDLRRLDAAMKAMPGPGHLAVDAMNTYDPQAALTAATALAPYGLWWFEDFCGPLDFETHAAVTALYPGPVAAGEALFSSDEARLLDRHGGLRREQDVLLFDPVHCYGLTGFLEIVDVLEVRGWSRSAFWPHGGHMFTLHGGERARPRRRRGESVLLRAVRRPPRRRARERWPRGTGRQPGHWLGAQGQRLASVQRAGRLVPASFSPAS
jgi:L-alanine-DL-glutamate epimerase-like enolase superfamily enzyme